MDTNVLVEAGRNLLDILDREGVRPRAALWVHDRDAEDWRLWVVPAKGITDQLQFYRQVAEAIAKHSGELPGLDASDTKFVADTHPLISGLSRAYRIDGTNSVSVTDHVMNGFFLADGIILRMAV